VLTKPEHLRNWFAPFECEMTECSIDLRVGGDYHIVFVGRDGTECSFRGTYLELVRPIRIVGTWRFDGWPDVEAVESFDLSESDGVTTLTKTWTFADEAGRAHMERFDGQESSFDKLERLLSSIRRPEPGAD